MEPNLPAYGDLQYGELQQLCKSRGINASGTKEDLVQKLKDDDANKAASPPPAPEISAPDPGVLKKAGESGAKFKIPDGYIEPAETIKPKPKPLGPTRMVNLSDIKQGLAVGGVYERRPGYLVKVVAFDRNHKGQDTVKYQKGINGEDGVIRWGEAGPTMEKDMFVKWLSQENKEEVET